MLRLRDAAGGLLPKLWPAAEDRVECGAAEMNAKPAVAPGTRTGFAGGPVPSGMPSNQEIEWALRRAWFPIARVEDLGQPRRVELLGEVLVVFLTEDGRPSICANRCPHRGAALSDGTVDGECIVCPYHGWAWRGDGSCLQVPSLDANAPIPPRAVVASHHAALRWGLVWCALDEPVVALPAPPALDGVEWEHGAGGPIAVAAGLRAATENFRDVAHFPFVHRKTMGELPRVVEPLEVKRDGIEVHLSRTYEAAGGEEKIWHAGMRFDYHAIAPGFVCLTMKGGDGGTRVLLNAPSPRTSPVSPASDGRHRTTIFWVEGFIKGFTAMTLDELLASEAKVYEEDNPILDRIEPSEAPLDRAAQVHTLADKYTLAYRQAFVEFVRRANSTEKENVPDHRGVADSREPHSVF